MSLLSQAMIAHIWKATSLSSLRQRLPTNTKLDLVSKNAMKINTCAHMHNFVIFKLYELYYIVMITISEIENLEPFYWIILK